MKSPDFDPRSLGAQKLARDWLPHLERWEVCIRAGHLFVEPDGTMVRAGETLEIPAPHGQRMVDRGSAEFVSRYRINARE